jgi:hypothetical protein
MSNYSSDIVAHLIGGRQEQLLGWPSPLSGPGLLECDAVRFDIRVCVPMPQTNLLLPSITTDGTSRNFPMTSEQLVVLLPMFE